MVEQREEKKTNEQTINSFKFESDNRNQILPFII